MLRNEVETAKRTVNTDRVQITIGEVSTMYKDGELNILPDFQRLHRWSLEKKSNFIESILIGIPIPPLFVFETNEGTWELVDGLQRVSTILEFMGVLREVDDPTQTKRSILNGTKYLPGLDGVAWEAKSNGEKCLEKSLQLFFRRARLDFEILKHPSNPKTKYDLFQRLNRGGAYANEQEVRTCTMVLADAKFTDRLRRLAAQTNFQRLFKITDDQRKNQKDFEYVVRLIVHTKVDFTNQEDVQEFLNNGILRVIEDKQKDITYDVVKWVVETLHRIGGDSALLPPDGGANSTGGRRFSLRALEVIAVGLARNKEAIEQLPDPDKYIRTKIKGFWNHEIAAELSSAGIRGTTRIQRSIPFGAKWFNPDASD